MVLQADNSHFSRNKFDLFALEEFLQLDSGKIRNLLWLGMNVATVVVTTKCSQLLD